MSKNLPSNMIKLLKMMEELLWYNEEKDNILVIKQEDFGKNGLSIEDAKLNVHFLLDKKILDYYEVKDRIEHNYPINYKEKISFIEDMTPLSGMFSDEILGTPLYFLVIKDKKKFYEFIKKAELPPKETIEKIKFDELNGVLSYGNNQYKIQSDLKLKLMRKLWEERKEVKIGENGKEKIIFKGTMWPEEALVRNLEIEENGKNEIIKAVKNLNIILKQKNFPIKIIMANGIQLIVKV